MNDIKVGDKVKILREFTDDDFKGEYKPSVWMKEMDETIGKIGTVDTIFDWGEEGSEDYGVTFPDGSNWAYALAVLEKVE